MLAWPWESKIVRLSVCPSVTRVPCDKIKQRTANFDTTRKGNHSSFLTPTVVGGRRPLPSKFVLKLTHLL